MEVIINNMSNGYDQQIYQELYSIRAEIQSMNMRSELVTIQELLREIYDEITKLRADINKSTDMPPGSKRAPDLDLKR